MFTMFSSLAFLRVHQHYCPSNWSNWAVLRCYTLHTGNEQSQDKALKCRLLQCRFFIFAFQSCSQQEVPEDFYDKSYKNRWFLVCVYNIQKHWLRIDWPVIKEPKILCLAYSFKADAKIDWQIRHWNYSTADLDAKMCNCNYPELFWTQKYRTATISQLFWMPKI